MNDRTYTDNYLPRKWAKIVSEARLAGLRVEVCGDEDGRGGCYQYAVIYTGKTNRSVTVALWCDGTATRMDIDQTITTAIKTSREVRRLLGLL